MLNSWQRKRLPKTKSESKTVSDDLKFTAKCNFSCLNGASAKKQENQKLLDCEIEFNRENSFNSENSFCFCSRSPFWIVRSLRSWCKNVQLARTQAAFLLCFGFLCMDDDNGLEVVPEKLLHFLTCKLQLSHQLRLNSFSKLRLRTAFYLCLRWCMKYCWSSGLYFVQWHSAC